MQTLEAFDRMFPDDESCKRFLVEQRWPDGVSCPRCGEAKRIYALKARPFHWICKAKDCGGRNGYRFSVITRTIFQDTKISLKLWFKVAYLVLTSKKGISALQVHRVIFGEDSGSAYHTSWYMVMRWRAAMQGDLMQLAGVVEVDETFIGGKDRNRHWAKKSRQVREAAGPDSDKFGYGKTGVIGAIARKGNVVCKVIGDMEASTKSGFVRQIVDKETSSLSRRMKTRPTII